MEDSMATRSMTHKPVTPCARCSRDSSQPSRLTLHVDDEKHPSVYADLCTRCTEALVMWLQPVRAA